LNKLENSGTSPSSALGSPINDLTLSSKQATREETPEFGVSTSTWIALEEGEKTVSLTFDYGDKSTLTVSVRDSKGRALEELRIRFIYGGVGEILSARTVLIRKYAEWGGYLKMAYV